MNSCSILNLFPLETTINFSSDCVDVGKKCPTADEHLQIQSKEATNRIDSFANANRRMTSVKQGKLSENYVKNYFFKQLHNLGLPLSVYSKNMNRQTVYHLSENEKCSTHMAEPIE
ncbi:hypothetical protein T03_14204 [Trichinella britovi]|uniref:Uncharacterized protein n=1 Tax=Trichinella britovi TaxID=45882 RepID=A0A0V1CLJ1_TRIBR|nr:hypothetical protein T03_14204 [Trichinella britovi]